MKLTRKALKKLILEEIDAVSSTQSDGVEEFKQMLEAHCPGAWEQVSEHQFFVSSGEEGDPGLTLRVMRAGR